MDIWNSNYYKIDALFIVLILFSSVTLASFSPMQDNDNNAMQAFAQTYNDSIRDIGNYVVFGLNKVTIGNGVTIIDGNVGVDTDQGKITIKKDTKFLDSDSALVSNKIIINKGGSAQNIFFNELTNKQGSEILGTQNTPLAFPVVNNLPNFPTNDPGTTKIIVSKDSSFVIQPGQYDKITVNNGATLIFSGGDYSATSIVAKKESKLIFNDSTQLVVQKRITLNGGAALESSQLSNIDASDITIFVGSNDPSIKGKPSAHFGINTIVDANVYVLDGTLKIGRNSQATGEFIAKTITVGNNAIITIDSAFATPIKLNVTKDSFLRSGNSNTNEGANPNMIVKASGNNHALVSFNMTDISGFVSDATLRLFIVNNADNWGADGRLIDVHRITETWVEGDGANTKPGNLSNLEFNPFKNRGDGEGVTWKCAIDSEINNQKADCDVKWNGGTFVAISTDSVIITKGLTDQFIEFDVTDDVIACITEGADECSWIVKKPNSQAGRVEFASKEGSGTIYDQETMPQLIIN